MQASLSLSLGSSSLVVPQDGTPTTLPVTINGTGGAVTVTVSGLPSGVTQQNAATSGSAGSVTLVGSAAAAAGNYTVTVNVSSGGQTASQTLTLVSAVVAQVGSATDTSLGVNGVMKQFMSTSFQVAEWDGDFFKTGTSSREGTLNALGAQHVRLQSVSGGIPMSANTGSSSDWDFTILDRTAQPVLASADQSPVFQIAEAPAWMCDSNGHLNLTAHLTDFANYAANLVRYYNKGGFDWGGRHFQSASGTPIKWWGVFNEPIENGMSAANYVLLYNAVVPAMLAVDPSIKFSAGEFSAYGLGTGGVGDPMVYLPPFVAAASQGGVNAQVDVVSAHFYSSCDQQEPDAEIMSSVPGFAANLSYFYQELKRRADLASVPVWVTETNINSDFADANGKSTCNPTQTFVPDRRGTSAFFAAWRPYAFSQLGKVGNQALYHWTYDSDQQYGEVDMNGNPYLSYWVDKALAAMYPSTVAAPGPAILQMSATESASVETLATKNADGSVTVMVDDHAAASAADNNGLGAPRTVIVDVSGLGTFSSATMVTIDAATNLTSGPAAVSVTPAARMTVTLGGYGVTFLTLKP